MPEHTPVLCPDCQSPLSTTDETCWNCGKEGALAEGREKTAAHAREVQHETAAASGGTTTATSPPAAADGDGRDGESLLGRLKRRLQRLRS